MKIITIGVYRINILVLLPNTSYSCRNLTYKEYIHKRQITLLLQSLFLEHPPLRLKFRVPIWHAEPQIKSVKHTYETLGIDRDV